MAAPALALPNGRGYEMVTPVDKPGEPFAALLGFGFGATPGGDRVFFHSQNSVVPDAPDTPFAHRSDRTATGWVTTSPIPAGTPLGKDVLPLAFSDDGERLVAKTFNAYDEDDVDAAAEDFYAFGPGDVQSFLTPNTVDPTTDELKILFATANDARDAVFQSEGPLLPIAADLFQKQLYENHDGELRFVAVDDAGVRLTEGGTTWLGSGQGNGAYISANAYSRDGSTIFFTTLEAGSPGERPGLYVRRNGSDTDPIPSAPAGANRDSWYVGATPDGSTAYFVTNRALVPEDADATDDLYAYDVATTSVERLSGGAEAAQVARLPVWVSDDGSRVYFTASGRLIAGVGSVTGNKTYVLDNGVLRFVADAELMTDPNGPSGNRGRFECGPTRMTPDGRYLLAETPAAIDPADADGGATDVYRYDVESGSWIRVSTGPADDGGAHRATITEFNHLDANSTGCDGNLLHLTHPMSDDGRYVFFQTDGSLVAGDANGKHDVYQWDAETGDVSLITSGLGSDNADFLDATPDGSSVFFMTRERLVAKDIDSMNDVYVARIGGGFPEPQPVPACRESECQGPGAPRPSTDDPSSLTFQGHEPPPDIRHKRVLKMRRLSAAAVRRLARGGSARVTVVAARSGRLVVRGTLTVGHRRAAITSVTASARAGKTTVVTVRLGSKARKLLKRRGSARLRLVADQTESKDAVVNYLVRGSKGASR